MKTEFKEEQKFNQWWLWLILIPMGVLPLIGIYKQLILGEKLGDNRTRDRRTLQVKLESEKLKRK